MSLFEAFTWALVLSFAILLIVGVLYAIAEFFVCKRRDMDTSVYEPYGYGKWRKVKR